MRIFTAFLLLVCISQYSQGDMALVQATNNYQKKLAAIEARHTLEVEALKKDLLAEYGKAIEREIQSGNKSPFELMKKQDALKKEILQVTSVSTFFGSQRIGN